MTYELGAADLRANQPAILPLAEVASTESSIEVCFDGASLRRANFESHIGTDETEHGPRQFRPQIYFVLEDGSELGPGHPATTGDDYCPQLYQSDCGLFGTCAGRVRAVRIVSPADIHVDRVYFKTRTPA